jgi:ElaB/YqjD/DUF883 family membrane-anchored ribosome-binding protein
MDFDETNRDRDRDFADEASGRWDEDPVTSTAGIGADDVAAIAIVEDVAPDDPTADDPEVEALVIDIEATRAEMSQTVDELGERLDPANAASRAGEAVREATIGKIESKVSDMTSTASDLASNAGQTAQEAGSGIVETIRRNPIPAAMAGIGIVMLVRNRQGGMSRSSGRSWLGGESSSGYGTTRYGSRYETSYAGSGSDWMSGGTSGESRRIGSNGGGSIGDTISSRASDAGDTVRDVADQARRTADQRLDQLGQTTNEAMSNVSSTANELREQAQRALESNPLAFGALAVAVGTAVGLAIPATSAEKQVMGQAGGQLIDKVENAVSQPLEQMQQGQQGQDGQQGQSQGAQQGS